MVKGTNMFSGRSFELRICDLAILPLYSNTVTVKLNVIDGGAILLANIN